MTFARVRIGIILTLLVLVAAPARAQTTSFAFIPNESDNTLTIFNTATGVPTTLAVGAGPTNAATSPDGRYAYVANSTAGTVSVIATADLRVERTLTVGLLPSGIAVTPDGRRVYVTNFGSGTVSVIDAVQQVVEPTPVTVCAAPGAIALTPDGQRALIACAFEPRVDILDLTTTPPKPRTIQVASPGGVVVAPDGHRAYVSNYLSDTVTPIDLDSSSLTQLTPITMGDTPTGLAMPPDGGRLFVVNSGSDSLRIVVPTSPGPIVTLRVGDTPRGVAVGPDGQTVYVVNGSDTVTVLSPAGLVTRPTGRRPSAFGTFISPAILVDVLEIGSDSDLASAGFQRFVPFLGGTLRSVADMSTNRTISVLAPRTGGGGTITTLQPNLALTGPIIGYGQLTKRGVYDLILDGDATHDGGTVVEEGALIVNGTHTGPITLRNDSGLGGTGRVSDVTIVEGTLSPGALVTIGSARRTGPGRLVTGTVTVPLLADAWLEFSIHGTVPGVEHDVLEASDIDLSNLRLEIRLEGLFVPEPGQTFLIMPHARGTFMRLGEGGLVSTNNAWFTITYAAGPNGDGVALTVVDAAPYITAPVLTDRTIVRNTVLGPIELTLSDDHTPATDLGIDGFSSDTRVIPDDGITFGGTGATRTLQIAPVVNATGSATITLLVDDGNSFVRLYSFLVTVTAAPPPPPPPPTRSYYLAEGATGVFFDTDVLIANPQTTPVRATLTFLTRDGVTITDDRTLAPTSRTTIRVDEIAGLDATEFSTVVTTPNGEPIVVERTMRWDASGYGAHTEKATDGAATQWFFAEGSQGFFSTYFLLVNPQTTTNTAHVTFLRENTTPLTKDYVIGPASRLTIDAGGERELVDSSFGARITFDQPGVVERAMYFGRSPLWIGGHESAGVTQPSTNWFLAEGATGSFFTTFILLANPGTQDATATVTFLPSTGQEVTRVFTVRAGQRETRNIADQDPSLASAAVATRVESDRPIIVERAHYWPNPNWYEAHNTFGVTDTATRWGLAEGRVGGRDADQTYILLANPGTQAATARLTFLRTNGTTIEKTFTVPPTSRFNVAVNGPVSDVPELADEAFGTIVEASQPIVVERSLYSNVNGLTWAAGTNATATRLP